MNLENQTYVRLDDDVSFQILRTNPKLTTNTKIMYDGDNIYLEAYSADPLLVTRPYRSQKVSRSNLFNNDIKNFLAGTNSAAYTVGQDMSDFTMGTSFDNQFETMYWCGVESLPSYTYEQEMGCVAPLYLRKKLPEYFVIFKVDTPANTNMVSGDETYNFKEDILKTARIIKTFDLKEGTPLGDYIRNYVGQRDFKYDQSIYVNFSSNEIYYYGIDRNNGTLTQKVENIKEQMLDNDYTILRTDERITCGFERNNLIFPYILNIEFLFDDNELSGNNDFKFARYFGMYCNTMDIQKVLVTGVGDNSDGSQALFVDWSDNSFYNLNVDETSFYYVKDKYNHLHSFDRKKHIRGEINIDDFTGYETNIISVPVEKVEGRGFSTTILKVTSVPDETNGEEIIIELNNDNGKLIKRYVSSYKKDERSFKNGSNCIFSCKGTVEDIAVAIAGAIATYPPADNECITAYSIGDMVFIEATFASSGTDDMIGFNVKGNINEIYNYFKKNDGEFRGGTDSNGCLFKVSNEYINLFTNNDNRYIKCSRNANDSQVIKILPYIDDDNVIDENYSLIITDWYGPYVKVSKSGHIQLMDRYYTKIGLLNFFPVRDFDFDTVDSSYGDYSKMKSEIDELKRLLNDNSDPDEQSINIYYGRFFSENGNSIDTEYDYFCENVLPELSVINKTVPFISKWGYTDDSKDSCENPYRLNASKIFDACNFSANTFVINGDIMEYTHSMPYYVVKDKAGDINEYQYIDGGEHIKDYKEAWSGDENSNCEELNEYVKSWVNFFLNDNTDNFDNMFGDCSKSKFNSKRFNKKYSRFLNGTSINNSSTLFRGVKFEIIEIDGEKEVKTSKYNGYKFSFIYIPSGYYSSKVFFVKNDTFKFIVGMMFFNTSDNDNIPFGKAKAYAGSLGFLAPDENSD